jgi:enamine deaminase RidA (YjgF/YER057c/UK114 family)
MRDYAAPSEHLKNPAVSADTSPGQRLRELGLVLPEAVKPRWAYVPVTFHGDLAFVSGQVPKVDGELRTRGRVGAEIDLDAARELARIAVLNALAHLASALDGIDAVSRILRVTGYVASAPDFVQQPSVIDGASELLVDIFGDRGRHARSAVGVAVLPDNAPVEIEVIAVVSGSPGR